MSVHIEQLGNGPDIVFLHGWGLHGGLFRQVAHELSTAYRCTLLDLPGHGNSAMQGDSFTLEQLTAQIAHHIPDDSIVIGWSLGGLVATQLALLFPDKVKKLLLVASSPRFVTDTDWPHATQPEVLASFAANLEHAYEDTLIKFLSLTARGSQQMKHDIRSLRDQVFAHGRPDVNALHSGLEILQTTDLRSAITGLSIPVHFIFGQRDVLVPPALCDVVKNLIPGCSCDVVAGAGHAPFLSRADEFIALTRQRLTE